MKLQPGQRKRKKIDPTWALRVLVVSALIFLFNSPFANGATVKGEISRVGEAAHLELNGLKNWPYEFKKIGKDRFQLVVPPLDDASIAQLATWSDGLVSQINVDKNGTDGKYTVTFIVADEKVESFDYLTDDPSRLIVDFYRQTEEAKSQEVAITETPAVPAETPKTEVPKTESLKKAAKGGPKKKVAKVDSEGYVHKGRSVSRKPAGNETLEVEKPKDSEESSNTGYKGGAFDAADPNFSRFLVKDYQINDEAIVASRNNIYLKFPMLKLPVSLIPKLVSELPEFEILPRDDAENKEARLLLSLYQRQIAKTDRTKDRIGAFLKVYDHFFKTYPKSEYDEIIKNLAAHIYYLRWQGNGDPVDYQQSQALYKYLISRYPESPLAERIHQWIAFSELDRGNGLGTLQEFQDYLNRFPKSEIKDQVQMALADGNMILDKPKEALEIYKKLERSADQPRFKLEAAFRMGDVFFLKEDWATAEKEYQRVVNQYPEAAKLLPNAYFNLGEAQFWQRKHRESLESMVKFLENFPSHQHGGYALTRIGEILEALGVDRSKVIGAYLESFYRFHNSPGASVARIRMLSQQFKGMKEKELNKALLEMDEIAKKVSLPRIEEFVVLMKADGIQRRGDNQKSLEGLMSYYQSHPTTANLDLFKTRIQKNISEIMDKQLSKGQFMDALKTQQVYSSTWLKNNDRIDVPYMIGSAYEQAGANEDAQKIFEPLLKKRLAIKGTPEEKVRNYKELLPTPDQIRLKMANAAVESRDFPKAFEQLRTISNKNELSSEENQMRIRLLAQVQREQGEVSEAIRSLKQSIDSWRGDPSVTVASLLELAELHIKSNDSLSAEKTLDQVIQMKASGTEVSDTQFATALTLKAESLKNQGKDLAAAETYQKLLEDFENQRPLGSVRFQLGQILFQKGDLAAAEKVWMKLDPVKYGVFRKIGEERIQNARWKVENKRYIQRIPAMAKFKEEK